MPSKPAPDQLLQEALDLYNEYGSSHQAAKATGIAQGTLHNRYLKALQKGMVPGGAVDYASQITHLENKIKDLTAKLNESDRQNYVEEEIRQKILRLSRLEPDPPQWIVKPPKSKSSPGVPTILCSDWHWGEVIRPQEIGGIPNKYNLAVARERVRILVAQAIDLLTNHMVNPDYPGIVVNLGGDMFSGDIHSELTETNEKPMMEAVLDLYGVLIWMLGEFEKVFGKVFVVGVVGNHSRTSYKPRNKLRIHTNFDWLLYQLLNKHFDDNKNISFLIPESADVIYRVYGHRYMLTHGDQFRGGDGIIGPIGPIVRGDVKKRTRQMQIEQNYDTLLCGHFHTLMMTRKFIVNGSLCGMNEYGFNNNFPYEPPMQALWITHPERGITFSMPVHVNQKETYNAKEWVSF